MRQSLYLLPALFLVGHGPASATSSDSPGDVLAAWSQFVSNDSNTKPFPTAQPTIEMRYVVASGVDAAGDAVGCDDFAIAYTDASGTSGITKAGSARTNPEADRFPIVVCAAALNADWAELRLIAAGTETSGNTISIKENGTDTGIGISLPGPHKIGRRHTDSKGNAELLIATLGDSGCRGSAKGQSCDEYGWPFSRMTKLAAETRPDLFLHVGDYRYYKQYDTAKRWNYWLKDLLIPARHALLAAPWAFTRGNHEDCSHHKSGVGFTYLFGVGDAACGADADVEPSWHFDVAPGGIDAAGKASDAHRFVMIDTSDEYTSELEGAFTDAIHRSQTDSVWWVSHIPPVHLLHYSGTTRSYNSNVRYRLSEAIKSAGPLCDTSRKVSAPCRPSLILLGHDHMFQSVTFGGAAGPFTWPRTYIVGHGGVDLRGSGLSSSSCTYDFDALPGSSTTQTGTVHTRREFGYVLWRRSAATVSEPAGWVADPRDRQGKKWRPFPAPTGDCAP